MADLSEVFCDCMFLIQGGFNEEEDHEVYKLAHEAKHQDQLVCAQIMTHSTSEIQAVKYMQFYLTQRPIEPGFRSKKLDLVCKIRRLEQQL